METYLPSCKNGQWVVVDSNGTVVEECADRSDSVDKANGLNGY